MNASSAIIQDDVSKVQNADRSQYRSLPIMTKYEFDELIALRTLHLSRQAPPLVPVADDFKVQNNMGLRVIALQELKEKKLPYLIKRQMPNGKSEYWKVKDLDTSAVEHLMR